MSLESPEVLSFRLERMKYAPSNWMFWIALFCILNGIFIANGEDITLVAGLIFPYLFESTIFHYIFGFLFLIIGYFSRKITSLIYIGLGIYILDMFCSFAIGISSGGIVNKNIYQSIAM